MSLVFAIGIEGQDGSSLPQKFARFVVGILRVGTRQIGQTPLLTSIAFISRQIKEYGVRILLL